MHLKRPTDVRFSAFFCEHMVFLRFRWL